MALQKVKKSTPMKIRKVVKKDVDTTGQKTNGQPEVKKTTNAKSTTHIYAVGRRKVASARIRLFHGGTGITVNGKPSAEYFKVVDPTGVLLTFPFKALNKEGAFSATVKVEGSGLRGQLEAVIHGLSRALVKVSQENKSPLRKLGLLTRDDRMRESRKMGTGGKARRQKQSPKR